MRALRRPNAGFHLLQGVLEEEDRARLAQLGVFGLPVVVVAVPVLYPDVQATPPDVVTMIIVLSQVGNFFLHLSQ